MKAINMLTIASSVPQGCQLIDMLGPLGLTGMYILHVELAFDFN